MCTFIYFLDIENDRWKCLLKNVDINEHIKPAQQTICVRKIKVLHSQMEKKIGYDCIAKQNARTRKQFIFFFFIFKMEKKNHSKQKLKLCRCRQLISNTQRDLQSGMKTFELVANREKIHTSNVCVCEWARNANERRTFDCIRKMIVELLSSRSGILFVCSVCKISKQTRKEMKAQSHTISTTKYRRETERKRSRQMTWIVTMHRIIMDGICRNVSTHWNHLFCLRFLMSDQLLDVFIRCCTK